MKLLKKVKFKRNCWTRPWIKRRNVFGAHHARRAEKGRSKYKCSYTKFSLFHFVSFFGFWTMLCVLHLFCGNFTPIYSINLLHPMQQEAFPHQYLRSRICFARTIAHAFIMVLVQMCNPKIDNFDWIKMKGQLRLVIRIEHCSIPSLFFRSIRQTNIPYNRIVNKIFSCRYPAP